VAKVAQSAPAQQGQRPVYIQATGSVGVRSYFGLLWEWTSGNPSNRTSISDWSINIGVAAPASSAVVERRRTLASGSRSSSDAPVFDTPRPLDGDSTSKIGVCPTLLDPAKLGRRNKVPLKAKRLIPYVPVCFFAGSPSLEGPAPFRFYAACLFTSLNLEASRPASDLSNRSRSTQKWGARAKRFKWPVLNRQS